jgi:HK97 family phage prohead protease
MRKAIKWMTIEEWKAKEATDKRTIKGAAIQKICSDLHMKQVDGLERAIKFTISSPSVDRDKDTLSVAGWKLDSFQRNPVVPFAHDYSSLPVAKAVNISSEKNALVSTAQFVPKEVYPFADTVYQMLLGGYLNAVSVGFRPLKHEVNKDRGGVDFLEQELLEYSVVPVPANPEALVEARSVGIDLGPLKEWAEEVLDELHGEAMVYFPKESIEQVAKMLTPLAVSVGDDLVKTAAEIAEEKAEEVKDGKTPETAMDPIVEETKDVEPDDTDDPILEIGNALLEGTVTETPEMKEQEHIGIAVEIDPSLVSGNILVDAHGAKIEKEVDEIELKVDPSVLENPLPESYEWTTRQLVNDAMGFLTRNGIDARTDGMDVVIPVSTFADSFVFCLMGRDRPFSEDPCFQGSYKRDKRLGGLPRFKGEPTKVDVQVSMDLVQASAVNIADFKQTTEPRKESPAIEPEVVSKQPQVFLDVDEVQIRELLGEVLGRSMENEVKQSVTDTINKLRGKID